MIAMCVTGTEPGGVHLGQRTCRDRNNSERSTDDRDQASSDEIRRFVNVEASDLDAGQDPADNQGCGYHVLSDPGRKIGTSLACNNNRRCDDTGQHRKSVLESKNQGEDNWHGVIQPKEGGGPSRFLEEGEIGLEQEDIVIVAEKTFSCRKGIENAPRYASSLLSKRFLWAGVRANLIWVH